MKTAISILYKVFESVEKLTGKLGAFCGKLSAILVKSHVGAPQGKAITVKLNKIYSQNDSKLDPKLKKLQAKAISRNRW